MNKLILGLLALVVMVFGVVLAPTAQAAQDPYPDTVCSISVSAQTVQSGRDFTVTVTSDRAADLTVTFNGETHTEPGARELVATFGAPTVREVQNVQITASCDGVARSAAIQVVPAGATAEGSGGWSGSALAGILPRTGGAALWILLLGAALAVVGGTVLVRRRA